MRIHSTLAAAALLASAATVAAHPKLVSTSPAANAAVVSPTHVDLRFRERLMPAFSKAGVTMAAMPGMAAMKIASSAKLGADGKTLMVRPSKRLPRGRYIIDWHVVSVDTHKASGSYMFAVK
ncbi:MAG: copper resistance system chaperone CopC [Sphingomicrobium sp.]